MEMAGPSGDLGRPSIQYAMVCIERGGEDSVRKRLPVSEAYNMDCMEYMRMLPDKAFDLAVVDPPYGINAADCARGGRQPGQAKAPSTDYGRKGWDKEPPPEAYFRELERVSRNQIIWGANHFISRYPRDSSEWLVWDKMNGNNTYADCELAWTSFPGAVRLFRFRWQGMLQGDMAHKELRIHPTQKPVALYAWIFSRYAKAGDRILDTHLGSGSSRIAAWDAGLDFVGCEFDRGYFEDQNRRFDQHTAQLNLFLGEGG